MFQIEQKVGFIKVKAIGKLTGEDYEKTLIPFIEKTIAASPNGKFKALLDMTEWAGMEFKAFWDDFSSAIKYRKEMEKVAVIGNKSWVKWVSQMSSHFMPGEMQYFDVEKSADAEQWIQSL